MTTPTPIQAHLEQSIEIAVRLAPTRHSAAAAAKAVATILADEPGVAIRLAGLDAAAGRVHLTLAVSLGSPDAVRSADSAARAGVGIVQRIVTELAQVDPALVAMPRPESTEAMAARAFLARHRGIDTAALISLAEDLVLTH